ncbi:MAG: hypothetical protein A2445_02580 [Candidatus Jacksonbacteria bacterium RIFOXYC2_FULL_44_29]|nr:MAG: D-alanine-D-alanine ligase [Parcubacteria group bacterium GW2011_GWA2_42_28]KKT55888.1 MAG: D-alanine-D-alanine ligase [Parcubacteria group bacterium GW2011_GWC2_44_22]OGY74502.1 MAG: hypothetical protein A2240_02835 [Candidatus Jacksonbacteria bacterium RIFOXYA2_FULL_43_12]OGY77411.1 MAG: hypothetical protein A2295_01785 [Candidatus Jacksonbacteria bacterium RIFOXYB2_FULL_44_15]OGY78183.1 MAG: hypothetical protein A2550_06130 [Candidatus Jacksonbacteria bacterium RIFOXYD2_FULL_43_21]O
MKKNILILFGGKSGEHDVSINSAASVIAHLDRNKYNVIAVAIDKTGRWLSTGESTKYLINSGGLKPQMLDSKTKAAFDISKSLTALRGSEGQLSKNKSSISQIGVVFPVLHGPFGEDGTVQGFLELWGVPFVGSDTLSSALAMDKVMAKKVFKAENIPTPESWAVNQENSNQIINKIKIPCVVKPVNLGSSVGVTIVKNKSELPSAIKLAIATDNKGEVIVEKFIKGRELTVPVLGDQALPVIEIRPKRAGDWFNYEVKYAPDLVDEIVPAPIPAKSFKQAQQLALRAHNALQCRHFSRVDMILTEAGELYVLEVNTIPGLTSASLFPKAAAASGMSFTQLLDKLIEMAS